MQLKERSGSAYHYIIEHDIDQGMQLDIRQK